MEIKKSNKYLINFKEWSGEARSCCVGCCSAVNGNARQGFKIFLRRVGIYEKV